MRKYKYSIFSAILFLVLWIPFVLKLKDIRLEIFPSIVFPSGASLAKKESGNYIFHYPELYGIKNGDFEKVDKNKLFKNIPMQNYISICKNDLGLKLRKSTFKLYKPPIVFNTGNYITEKNLNEIKIWYRERLKEQNFSDSIIVLSRKSYEVSVETGSIVKEETINEKTFKLY